MKKDIFDSYAIAIANKFGLTFNQMFERTKKREIVDARQMLYYLCRERPVRISYIQRFMKEQGHSVSHSTIIHGYKKAKILINKDNDFKQFIKQTLDSESKSKKSNTRTDDVTNQKNLFEVNKKEDIIKLKEQELKIAENSDFSVLTDNLIKINELKEKGILTDEEFQKLKMKLLS